MANKQINVNLKVDDQQVKKAAGSTESLVKEIRRLQLELQKVEIGSQEFEQLSEQLKDSRDQLDLVRAKSADLFDSFSMLPGPIGEIGSTISSTSDRLKIFSSFNLKDLKGQFKAVIGDIGLVASNIGKATGITKIYEATTRGLGKAFQFFGLSSKAAGTAAKGFGKALIGTGIGAIVVAVGSLIANFDSLKSTLFNLIPGLGKVADFVGGLINGFTDLIGVTSKAEREQKKFVETLEKDLKKQQQSWDANADKYDDFTKRKVEANNRFKEKQIEILKDETMGELEKNKLIKQYRDQANREIDRADQDRQKKVDEGIKQEQDKIKQNNEKKRQLAEQQRQKDKERRQADIDAQVANLKEQADTDEKALREALTKQFAIRSEGKKLSEAQQKQQSDEINRIVQEELNKDKEARKKAFDDRVKSAQENSNLIIQTIDVELETLKLKYGEDSKEFRARLDEKFEAQKTALDNEENILKEKEKTKDGLTEDEIRRLKEIENERKSLTNTIQLTNNQQVQSDLDKQLRTLDNDKKNRDAQLAFQMESAGMNFELQSEIAQQQLQSELDFFAQQQILYKGNKEKLDEIDRARQASLNAFFKTEEDISKKRVQLNLQAADAVINAFGAESAAGRAALIAKQIILAKELFLEAKRNISFAKGSFVRSKAALAEGTAQTAKVGFPQNIPLLILYAVQAASIIKTLIQATQAANQASNEGANLGGTPSTPSQPQTISVASRANGGFVFGSGTDRSDSIPALLSNGEFVMNANSSRMFGGLLTAMNDVGNQPQFAVGGLATMTSQPANNLGSITQTINDSLMSRPIKTYVTATDMSTQQQLERTIKSRSVI